MAKNLGVSIDECKEILEEFFKMFPNIKSFTEGNEQTAREKGYVEDYLGRRRHLEDINLPDLNIVAKRNEYIDNITLEDLDTFIKVKDESLTNKWIDEYNGNYKNKGFKKKTEFKELATKNGIEVRDNGAFISKTMTQCTNSRVQGSAASLTKKAMVCISQDKRLNEIGFRLMIPVHDELLGECPIECAEECGKLLSEAMIRAGKPECSVAMKVDTYVVKHWYADEVDSAIRAEYYQYINGDPKKGIEPISRDMAIDKLCKKHSELEKETIIKMCDDKFNLLSDRL